MQWAKEKLRVEVGRKTELAKQVLDKLLSRKQDFATGAVSEGMHAIAKSVGGSGGGGGDKGEVGVMDRVGEGEVEASVGEAE